MERTAVAITLASLMLTAIVLPFVSIPIVHSQTPEAETFTIPVQKDSFLTQGSQTNNEGANIILNIKSSDKHRPVIAFDQNEIANAVDGKTMLSAVLKLYVIDNGNNWGSGGNTIGAHRLLADWHEGNGWNLGNNIAGTGSGTTWGCAIDSDISNNQNNCAVQWDGGSFHGSPTSNVLITNNLVNQWVEFNVTSDVQAFLDGTANNYGWMVKKTGESMNGDIEFSSREAGTNAPVLQITVIRPEFVLAFKYLALIEDLEQTAGTFGETAITAQTIEGINATLMEIEDTVVQLQDLGFDGYIRADNIDGQMIGTVKFNNSDSYPALIETQIPSGTLGIFMAMSFAEGLNAYDAGFNSTQIASLLNGSSAIIEVITAAEHELLASDIVLASISSYHPSSGNTVYLVVAQERVTADSYFGKQSRGAVVERVGMGINDPNVVGPIADAIDVALNVLLWDLYPYVKVEGITFNDLNANGAIDDLQGEPGLANFTFRIGTIIGLPSPIVFELFRQGSGGPAVAVSNSTGHFEFSVRVSKFVERIIIVEEGTPGWKITTPAFGLAERSFTNPGIICNPLCGPGTFIAAPVQFGNFQLGEISGFKYNDANGNGVWDAGEQGLPDWTILLKNATGGATINSDVTDNDGLYLFTGLQFGSYTVEEVQQVGYTQTEPASGSYAIDIQSGTFSLGNDFGNTNATTPQVVFQENFDSGTAGWSQTFCQVSTGQACSFGTATTPTPVPSPPNWGRAAMDDTERSSCSGEVVSRHAKTFAVPEGGNFEVSSWLWGSPCDVCNIFANLFVDGTPIFSRSGQNALFNPPQPPVQQTAVVPLSAGQHTMEVEMRSAVACHGLFRAQFDNITVTSTQASPTGPYVGGPYHDVELNQTSANVTSPDTVTAQLEVEWYDPAWPAQPVDIMVLNATGTGINYTIESISNTTEHQTFEITFNVTAETQAGEYSIPILVNEIGTVYTETKVFVLRVE